jgi:hypothetical protein
MIEIERQISEAPDICVIIRGFPRVFGAKQEKPIVFVHRYTDEDGKEIPQFDETGKDQYKEFGRLYKDEILAALDDAAQDLRL